MTTKLIAVPREGGRTRGGKWVLPNPLGHRAFYGWKQFSLAGSERVLAMVQLTVSGRHTRGLRCKCCTLIGAMTPRLTTLRPHCWRGKKTNDLKIHQLVVV